MTTNITIFVDATQGTTTKGRDFGYVGDVAGEGGQGGYFFTYANGPDTSIEAIIDSMEEDTEGRPEFDISLAISALRKWDAAGRPGRMKA